MITFIDLFCGIGGFRIGLTNIGAKCLFSSDINPHSQKMYEVNFQERPFGDITLINPEDIPNFDILCAGFPCQPFSQAGKKLGFEDERGNMFFNICKIVSKKKPKVLFLENVKNLLTHDKGDTFHTIKTHIDKLGYNLFYEVLSSKDFGVPQHRERIILIAIRKDLNKTFDFNKIEKFPSKPLFDFLDKDNDSILKSHYLNNEQYTIIDKNLQKEQKKSGLIFCGYLNKNIRKNGVLDNTLHLSRTHKQCNRIYDSKGIHPTLSSQESSGRYYIYIETKGFGKVRKLTMNECYRIMGFPEDFIKIEPNTQLYARIGNSVCVPMIQAIAKEIKKQIF